MSKNRAEIVKDRFEAYDVTVDKTEVETQVYLPAELKIILGIGKSKVYEFLKEVYESDEPPFKVIKIGKLFRVPKKSFDEWLANVA